MPRFDATLEHSRRRFLYQALSCASVLSPAALLAACGGGGGYDGSGTATPMKSNIANLGPLQAPDANGLSLPAGFKSRIVARAGAALGGGGYAWHNAPDGGACFALASGGWIYVSNSEVAIAPGTAGGVGALQFDADGNLVAQYAILSGTNRNCAGGATPWGTWLSCEEVSAGQVWECVPTAAGQGTVHPALGIFSHEAIAVDAPRRQLFMTEDAPDGRFYRFVPTALDWPPGAARPALQAGALQVLAAPTLPAAGDLTTTVPVTWKDVLNAGVAQSTVRDPAATAFNGGEGIWCRDGIVHFSTKGDNRIWRLDTTTDTLRVVYDDAIAPGALTGVDNVLVSSAGDVLVAEDGGDMEIRALAANGATLPIVQVIGQAGSEITGPALSPDGMRLYFSSQRGPGANGNNGITYEVSGPFFVPA